MRSIILSGARSCLIAFLVAGLLNVPAMAAPAQPLGMIVGAENALLGRNNAVNGADIYVGDNLVTYEKGSLRFKVGANQFYLLASSAARLNQREAMVQVAIDRGTLGFSTPNSAQLEIATPIGMLRSADGKPFSGQVAILASGKMRVTSFKGSFIVNSSGQDQAIPEGQTWEATLAADSAGGSGSNPPPVGVGSSGTKWTRIAIVVGIAAAAFVVACTTWPESNSGTGCW